MIDLQFDFTLGTRLVEVYSYGANLNDWILTSEIWISENGDEPTCWYLIDRELPKDVKQAVMDRLEGVK